MRDKAAREAGAARYTHAVPEFNIYADCWIWCRAHLLVPGHFTIGTGYRAAQSLKAGHFFSQPGVWSSPPAGGIFESVEG